MIFKKRRLDSSGAAELNLVDYDRREERLRMTAGSIFLAKTDVHGNKFGEDDHFFCQEKQTIGLADGVGGWATMGVDAGKYARELMANSRVSLQRQRGGFVNPKRVMQEAYAETTAEGSSTACIISLIWGKRLRFANVGDSGFMVFRNKRLVYASPRQQYYFDCPYQLGNGPECESPSAAYEGEVAVEAGDIVVAGTDGLFDNLDASEIEDILNQVPGVPCPEQYAWSIGMIAAENKPHMECDSPFGIQHHYSGGKNDDITVVVAEIVAAYK